MSNANMVNIATRVVVMEEDILFSYIIIIIIIIIIINIYILSFQYLSQYVWYISIYMSMSICNSFINV